MENNIKELKDSVHKYNELVIKYKKMEDNFTTLNQ